MKTEELYKSRLLTAKARVTSLRGSTAPRSELQAILINLRVLVTVVKSMVTPPESIAMLTDSECSIAAMEKSGGLLLPFFANRVGEAHHLMAEIREVAPLELLHHVAGPLNIADLATRDTATPGDIGPKSTWLEGPAFLQKPRHQWPVSREFCDAVPKTELRIPLAEINLVQVSDPTSKFHKLMMDLM